MYSASHTDKTLMFMLPGAANAHKQKLTIIIPITTACCPCQTTRNLSHILEVKAGSIYKGIISESAEFLMMKFDCWTLI